ncbi:hypothetical protein [Mycobacterium sp.]|uniref:hypothetical protein n=1 Tax=Mycobacterium sp. TaxID=1785 RepID=UPI003BA9158D
MTPESPKRSQPNTFGYNISDLSDYVIADMIRELSLKGSAVAGRVGVDRGDELGVPAVDRVTT